VRLLVDLARHGGLPFDAIFSAELFGHYKPDPEVYLGGCRLLDLPPARVTLVAAHPDDLRAAAACGLGTALVRRPDEQGRGRGVAPYREGEFDLEVDGFDALAAAWGA
jgi:2-haloacid dehalogenase